MPMTHDATTPLSQLFEIIASTLKQYHDEEEEGPDQNKIFGMLRNTAIKKMMTPKSQEERLLGIIVSSPRLASPLLLC